MRAQSRDTAGGFKHHFLILSRQTVYQVNADVKPAQLFVPGKKFLIGMPPVYKRRGSFVNRLKPQLDRQVRLFRYLA